MDRARRTACVSAYSPVSVPRLRWAIVRLIAAKPDPVVFMLWGSYAQKKAAFVKSVEQGGQHLVLKAPHPSPLSAYNGFFGCKHFSKANAFFEKNGLEPIDWSLPPVDS